MVQLAGVFESCFEFCRPKATMRMTRVSIYELTIPFRLDFSHNLFKRSQTECVVVVIEDDKGLKGFGEGTPRSYVTGESLSECLQAMKNLGSAIPGTEVGNFGDLTLFLENLGLSDDSPRYPSALCAIELALLDLWSRGQGKVIWQLFADTPAKEVLIYSAVIPLVSDSRSLRQLLQMVKNLRLEYVKLKVEDCEQGIEHIGLAREILGHSVDLRADANGAFSAESAIEFCREVKDFGLSALEQPVPKEDLIGLRCVSEAVTIPIFADESVSTPGELEYLLRNKICRGINIRLSKCGGFLRSLKMCGEVISLGGLLQIGCHVGETAILSAAGRNLAALCPVASYLEGSFSKYLLTEDLSIQDITFGPQGHAYILSEPGHGISFDFGVIEKWGRLISTLS
jgi:L-Ala-D/L-Glu epimerase